MIKKIPFNEAIGRELCHDITEIRPGQFKGAAFRKGHVIHECDCAHFKRLGKENFYEISMEEDEYHENDAAELISRALCGAGVSWFEPPHEGKIVLRAKYDGLLKIDVEALARFNLIQEVMCATLHTNTLVQKGAIVAATRAIPLVMKKSVIHHAVRLAESVNGVASVMPLRRAKTGFVITGNEVFSGLVKDRFEPILRKKVEALGSEVIHVCFAPDDKAAIAAGIKDLLAWGADLILTSGGMSVDPDDVTREGVLEAGADRVLYGSAVLPGAMFMMARIGNVPVLGTPACGLFHKITVLDLILPRVLAGDTITEKDVALMGHGGLCMNCQTCIYPRCAFGKGH
jgi:hypothetical protein